MENKQSNEIHEVLPQVEFDESLAQTYEPLHFTKQVVLIPIPEGVNTTIKAEWGSEQSFVGPWYAVYVDGKVAYGIAQHEFAATHDVSEWAENGYYKCSSIDAYQYHGADATVATVLTDGTVETVNSITDGDWIGKWPHGEFGVFKDEIFRARYNVDENSLRYLHDLTGQCEYEWPGWGHPAVCPCGHTMSDYEYAH